MQFLWTLEDTKSFWKRDAHIEAHRPHKKLSPNLKEFEITGYLGSLSEYQHALDIIKNAANLEKVIVTPCCLSKTIQRESFGRARRDFRLLTPAAVKLIII